MIAFQALAEAEARLGELGGNATDLNAKLRETERRLKQACTCVQTCV